MKMSDNNIRPSKSSLPYVLGFLAFWANGENYAAASLLPSIAADLKLSISEAGLSVTAYMLSFGLFTIIFGPLSDKFGKGRVIKVAALGTSLFSILVGFSFNLESLMFFRVMSGLLGAGIFPVTMALIGAEFGDRERQGAMAKVLGLGFLGGALATVIGGVLAQFGSWRGVYILYGLAELVLSILVLRLVPNGNIARGPFNIFKFYAAAFRNPQLISMISVVLAIGFSVFGSFSFSGYYVQTLTGFPIITVGLIVAAFGVGSITSSKLLPVLQPILKTALVPVAGIVGALSVLTLLIPLASGQPSTPSLVIGYFGFGLAFVLLQSTLVMNAQAQLPMMRGTVMSLVSFGMFVGGGLGSLANGALIASGHIEWMYIIAGVLTLSGAFSLWTILSIIGRKRRHSLA
ncbi:MFS transporter [Pleomorphomonas oryzae]|uniref:MFS transporter n=1 Tax=Pleomorphomonas oryzae TaxID=261934 RepID=UPI00041B8D1C|nr:MFS transporter [Pleomorphomonas oryzae]